MSDPFPSRKKRFPFPKDQKRPLPAVPLREPLDALRFHCDSSGLDRALEKRILGDLRDGGAMRSSQDDPLLSMKRESSAMPGGSVTDVSLVSAMATRLNQVETAFAALKLECDKKDRTIRDLRHELVSAGPAADIKLLREANAKLRQQLSEMEEFLADYGLRWVGDSQGSSRAESPVDWVPATSVADTADADTKEACWIDMARVRSNV
jgi:hypothetical protein